MTVGSHPLELARPDNPLEVQHLEANEKLTQTSLRGTRQPCCPEPG